MLYYVMYIYYVLIFYVVRITVLLERKAFVSNYRYMISHVLFTLIGAIIFFDGLILDS